MPTTSTLYNHTVNRFNEGLNAEGDTYKVMLLSASASFDPTAVDLTVLSAYEVSGNGWPAGGYTLTGIVTTVSDTNGGIFDADDVSQAISGGDLGPYSAVVVYNDTAAGDPPVLYVALESPITITSGNSATIEWNASGLISWSVV